MPTWLILILVVLALNALVGLTFFARIFIYDFDWIKTNYEESGTPFALGGVFVFFLSFIAGPVYVYYWLTDRREW